MTAKTPPQDPTGKSKMTDTAKHTPGPWRTIAPNKDFSRWFVSQHPHCGGVPPNKFYVAILEPTGVVGQDVADARLIAAAPDLLEAAKDLLVRLHRTFDTYNGETDIAESRGLDEEVEALWDAIESAEGAIR